jgi:GWxTD domain-containing protein
MKRGNMRVNLMTYLVIVLFAIAPFTGCSNIPRSFNQSTLDDIYPFLTDEQYKTLKSLGSKEEVSEFLDNYWQDIDSTSGTKENELRQEYIRRLEYANEHFPDRRGWGRSDRKRVYLIYGPPCSIERYEDMDIPIGKFSIIKSLEIWTYLAPGRNISFPLIGEMNTTGGKKFIFADMTGSGFYTILYSSEDCGDIDIRLYQSQ